MKFRFITPTLHGVADYSAGIGLITAPFLLNLGAKMKLPFGSRLLQELLF